MSQDVVVVDVVVVDVVVVDVVVVDPLPLATGLLPSFAFGGVPYVAIFVGWRSFAM